MTSIGECLRRERLRRNLQLEQVSSELKISPRMLAAIESEDFGKLPGGVFAKSFVRQYAHLLGLDEEELAAEVERMLRPEQPVENSRPEITGIPLPRMEAWQSVGDSPGWGPRWSSSLPALMLVVVVMLVCSGIYAFWQRHPVAANQNPQGATSPVNAVKASAPQSAPAPAAQTPAAQEAQPPQPAEAARVTAPAGAPPQTAETGAAAHATAPASAPPQTAETGAGAAAAPANPATPPGPVHVEVTATEPVWVRAVSDGKYVFSGTIDANQTRTVDGTETVTLRLGNAGGVNIVLNGKPIGPVGPKGQVRNVQLTPGGFQIVAPPKSDVPLDPL